MTPTPAEIDVVVLSLKIALAVVAVSLVPGVCAGYLLARWRGAGSALLRAVLLLPLVLPPVVTGYVLIELVGRDSFLGRAWHALTGGHLSYSTAACVVAAAVVGFPLLVESCRLSFAAQDRRMELVSRTLGRGRVATFFRLTLPLAAPGVAAGATLVFARALGEFGATIVLAGNIAGETRQIPLAVYTLLNQPGGEGAVIRLALASAVLSIAALGGVALLGRRAERGRPRGERGAS